MIGVEPARIVALEGVQNLRDLGGYPAADGRRTRWGRIYRAASLSALDDAGWAQLRARGIATICDLRTKREREKAPFPNAGDPGLSYWAGDYRASFAELRETMAAQPSADAARAGMIAGYRDLPIEHGPSFRRIFAHLLAGEVPLLFNCVAGKDRTGMAAALILTALGVPREVVIADYVLTDAVYDVRLTLLADDPGRHPPGVMMAIARADPSYIEAALDAVDERHGGILRYLDTVLGVDAAALRTLRTALLE